MTKTVSRSSASDMSRNVSSGSAFRSLATEATEQAIAVPREAVQLLEGRQVVFIRSGATEFRVRPVTVGRLSGRLVEITEGLAAGDLVVTTGAFKLKSALLAGTLGDDDDDEAKESQR